jgi:hypothetical protein
VAGGTGLGMGYRRDGMGTTSGGEGSFEAMLQEELHRA